MFQRHGKVPNFTTLVPMMSIVHSRVSPSIIDIKDKVWQTVFVSDILQACLQMSAISFVACKNVEKRNLSACNKGNRRCEPRLPWAAMVGKIQWIKDNIPIIYILSFRHFLVKNKLFY